MIKTPQLRGFLYAMTFYEMTLYQVRQWVVSPAAIRLRRSVKQSALLVRQMMMVCNMANAMPLLAINLDIKVHRRVQ